MLSLPYGGLYTSAGATGLALTTTNLLVSTWTAATQGGANANDGDVAVQPDVTNNRLKLAVPVGVNASPFVYSISFDCSGVGGGTADVIFKLRKNGLTVLADLACEMGASTARSCCSFVGYLKLVGTDLPTGGGLSAFADPAAATPSYAGAGGAPKNMTYVEVLAATLASTVTFTPEYAHLTAERVA